MQQIAHYPSTGERRLFRRACLIDFFTERSIRDGGREQRRPNLIAKAGRERTEVGGWTEQSSGANDPLTENDHSPGPATRRQVRSSFRQTRSACRPQVDALLWSIRLRSVRGQRVHDVIGRIRLSLQSITGQTHPTVAYEIAGDRSLACKIVRWVAGERIESRPEQSGSGSAARDTLGRGQNGLSVLLALISYSTTSTRSICTTGSVRCIEWGEDTETKQKDKSQSNPACDVRSQKASLGTRFVLGNLCEMNAFAMVGAPGLEPGTR